MTDEARTPKIEDFERNPSYEQRLVVFYDFLGWRNHIERAGGNPKQIGRLRRVILRHSRSMRLRRSLDIRASTFSDNIVISQALGNKNQMLLQQVAIFQFASAMSGFLMRGGITIGDVVHDDEAVFGPALNRAYHLESKIADVPRVLVDVPVMLMVETGDLAAKDQDGNWMLDPFTLAFCEHLKNAKEQEPNLEFDGELPQPKGRLKDYENAAILGSVLETLIAQVTGPLHDKEWRKVAWLHDRVARELKQPLAETYDRVRL
jgi:hypothetical protein